MKERLAAWFGSQRSQGMTEFAIIAPVLLLLTFGIIDFGRGLYMYITLQEAANEGARVAVRASWYTDPNNFNHNYPTNADVQAAVQANAVNMTLGNPCANGPIPNNGVAQGSPSLPAPGTGWIFITDPSVAGNGSPNAPAGQAAIVAPPGCNSPAPAFKNEPLKITLWYNFQPLTPLITQAVGNQIVITAYAVYRAEYQP
jgi:hypothetical protein